jgi:hypothetical protein
LSLCFCIALKQTKEGANLLLGKWYLENF